MKPGASAGPEEPTPSSMPGRSHSWALRHHAGQLMRVERNRDTIMLWLNHPPPTISWQKMGQLGRRGPGRLTCVCPAARPVITVPLGLTSLQDLLASFSGSFWSGQDFAGVVSGFLCTLLALSCRSLFRLSVPATLPVVPQEAMCSAYTPVDTGPSTWTTRSSAPW